MTIYPEWIKRSFSPDGTMHEVNGLLESLGVATVCESALCPNMGECYGNRQVTFMILGKHCTRSCRFCAVENGRPDPVDIDEPRRIAEAVGRLGLQHVVVTSVTRDDLPDEGAGHFISVMAAIRNINRDVTVEVLIPDFHAREKLVRQLLEEGLPDVFGHNVETVKRLSSILRPQGSYFRSLEVLRLGRTHQRRSIIKSGIMVGLGETALEVRNTLRDLAGTGVTHVTIGQYLCPNRARLPVTEYVNPETFKQYEHFAYDAGLEWVKAGPFVRSSYHAIDAFKRIAEPAVEI